MLSLIVMYKNDPLIQLSPEWFVPLNKIIAFPTGVPGTYYRMIILLLVYIYDGYCFKVQIKKQIYIHIIT